MPGAARYNDDKRHVTCRAALDILEISSVTWRRRVYTEKSPGGSIYPYYFKGGQLFGLHYGSFHENEAGLLARMHAE